MPHPVVVRDGDTCVRLPPIDRSRVEGASRAGGKLLSGEQGCGSTKPAGQAGDRGLRGVRMSRWVRRGSPQRWKGIRHFRVCLPVLLVASLCSAGVDAGRARAATSGYVQAVLADHPVAYWQFNDPLGYTQAADSSGNGNTLTYNVYEVMPGAGGTDGALSVGGGDTSMTNSALSPLVGDAPRTLETWFQIIPSSYVANPAGCVLTAGSQAHAQAFSLCVGAGPSNSPAPGAPGFYLQTFDADLFLPVSGLADGNWHYLAVTLTGNTVNVVIDGQQPQGYVWNGSGYGGITQQPFTLPNSPNTASTPLGFGTDGWMGGMNGNLDEVAVYPTALPVSELVNHYDAITSGGSSGGGSGGGGSGPTICPSGQVGTPPACAAPPIDVSGGGPPAATCATHVKRFGPFTVYGACFTEPKPGVFAANGRVRLNGVDIDPGASGSVTLNTNPSALSVSAKGEVSVRLGTYRILHRSGSWTMSLKVLPLTFESPSDLKVKGLPLSGKLVLSPSRDGMDVTAQAGIGVLHLTGDVGLHVSNQSGLSVSKLDVTVGDVPLGPVVRIQGGSLAYSRTSDGHDKWSAMVTIKLPPGFPDLAGNLTIVDGKLQDIAVSASDINRDFFGVVFLQSLGLDVNLVPNLKVTGNIGLSAGPKIPVLKAKAMSLDASLTADFGSPVVFSASGTLKVADKVQLGDATARWAVPNQFSATGEFGGEVGPDFLHLSVHAKAKVAVAKDGFAIRADGDVSLPAGEGQGIVYVSEKGITAVGYAHGPTVAGVTVAPVCVGVGYPWGGSPDFYFDNGCEGALKFSSAGHFSPSSHAAASGFALRIPARQSQALLGATALSGVPSFTLRSPGGKVIAATAGMLGTLGRGTYLVEQDSARHGTYVVISRPQPGVWTLTPTSASAPLTGTVRAFSPPQIRVKSAVRRDGDREMLTWRATEAAGATLRFSDVGPFGARTILTTTRAVGTASFSSAGDGRGGRDHVEILVTRHGLPQTLIKGGSFTVPRPAAPRTPRHLRLRHKGSTVSLTWSAVSRTYLYAVRLATTSGQRKDFQLPPYRRRVTLTGIVAPDTVKAAIQAVSADGQESRPAIVELRLKGK